jgi:uncharacterized lipoprotein NlpE involved in copper resistance
VINYGLTQLNERKEGIMKKLLVVCLMAVPLFLVGCESAQQKAYDLKADTVGTHRVVEVYTEAGSKVATIEDGSMRFEMVGERSVRLWLGDKNEKVMIGNMGFIITDK